MNARSTRPFWSRISSLFMDVRVCETAYTELSVEVLEAREMLSADITGVTLLTDSGIANDGYTTTPVVVATINNTTNGANLTLQVDANNDGTSDFAQSLGTVATGSHQYEFDSSSYHLTDRFGQQNLSFRVVSDINGGGPVASQWHSFSFNRVDEDRQLGYEAYAHLALGSIGDGAPINSAATGVGYLLYSEQATQARFGFASAKASNLFVAKFDATINKWSVNDGTIWIELETRDTDRVLAQLNLSSQTSVVLPDSIKMIGGVQAGVKEHTLNLGFENARNSPVRHVSVQGIAKVSLVTASAYAETLMFGNLRSGIAVPDDAVGIGYFMYSATDLAVRFNANPLAANTSAQIVCVRFNGEMNHWEYSDGEDWHQFQIHATDRLLAIVDLSARVTRNLSGEVGDVFGIKQGFSDSDISIVSNQFGGNTSEGDYQVSGSYARIRPSLSDALPTFDFGKVSRGSNASRTLKITNVFDHAIEVQDISLPFGFSAPNFVPGVLLPGQSKEITIRLDGIFPGDASGAIGIKTVSKQVESVQTLEIKAQITSPAMVLEHAGQVLTTGLDWGVVTAGQTVTREITVRNTGVGVLSLGDLVAPAGFEITTPLSSLTLAAGQTATFSISFTGGTVALNSGLLQILPAGGGLPLQILNVLAEVDVPRLTVRIDDGPWNSSNDRISFGTVVAGQTLSRTLMLKNSGVAPLEISTIDVPAGIQISGFSSPVTLQAGQALTLQVSFASTAGSLVSGSLLINSNDPNDAEFPIDVAAVSLLPTTPVLLNDHGPTPGVSNDPRIFIALSPSEFSLPAGIVRAHVDSNGDGTADDIISLTSTNFIYDPNLTAEGSFTRRIRFEIIDPVTDNSVYTSWQVFSATLDTSIVDQPASIVSVTLAGDNVAGNSMMSAAIEGVVANDGSFLDLLVQIDFDGDEVIDGVTTVRPDGTFRFEAFGLSLGSHLWVVTLREFPYQAPARSSDPVGVEFNLIPYPAPEFVSIALKQDTGSSNSDRITSQPFIAGQLNVSGDAERYRVYWDTNQDGEYLNWVVVDSNGDFEVDFSSLGVGHHTIYMKAADLEKNVESDAESLSVQLTSIETPTIVSFSLVGGVQSNGTTNDVALHGTLTSEWGVADRQVQFDIDGDGFIDEIVTTDVNGHFQFAPRSLSFGTHTVRARTSAFDPTTESEVLGDWSSVAFDYQKSLTAIMTNFGLTGNNGSTQVVEPLISGTVTTNGVVGRYVEVEFDYDSDGVADGFSVTDFFGNFTHFADTKIGAESTVRARVRSLDPHNNQYIYGTYQEVTFTRIAGQPRLATSELTGITDAAQAHSARVWDALKFAVNGLQGQFNGSSGGPSGGGSVGGGGMGGGMGGGTGGGNTDYFVTGFNVAGVSLALATANQSFGVTPVDEFSFQSGHESRYILMGNVSQGPSANSGSYSFTQNNGSFNVIASMNYQKTVSVNGTLNFSYTMTFTFQAGMESISGSASGSFTKSMTGGIGFSENLVLNGTVHADNYYFTTNYLSSIGITGGQVNFDGTVSYGLSRSETINNSAGFSRVDTFGTLTGTASQNGTYSETILATNIGSTGGAVQKTFDRDFQTEIESTETYNRQHSADGFIGTESRSRTDSYTLDRDETGGMQRVNGLWTVGETQFHNVWTTVSDASVSVNGTFWDPIGHQSILLGAVTPDSAPTNNLTTYAVNSVGSRVDTVGYDIQGEFNLQSGIDATFTWTSNSDVSLDLSLVTNSPPTTQGDQTTLTAASLTYSLDTDDYFGLSGSYAELGTTVTVVGTGNTINNSNLSINNQSVVTTTSPSLFSSSTRGQSINAISNATNSYNFSSLTPDHTGSYSMTQTTNSQLTIEEEVIYTNHQLQATVNYQRQPATLNGFVESSMSVISVSVVSESGDYSVVGSVTTTAGDFSKSFTESTDSASESDLAYVTNAGNYENIQSESWQTSDSTQTDVGTFSSVNHGDPALDSLTTNGNYSNVASTEGFTWMRTESYELVVIPGYPVVVTRLESYEIDSSTDFESESTEGGSYTSLTSLLNNSRTGSGWHLDTSSSNSTTEFSQDRSGGPWSIGVTNNVTTTSNSAGGGTYTEASNSITHNDWYQTSSSSTGSGSTTLIARGDGYGSTVITTTEFESTGTDNGTVTGTRAKTGPGSADPLTKSGNFTLTSSEENSSYYHDYSHRSGGGLTVDSESVTNVTSNVDSTESGTYFRGSDGIMTRNGSFSAAVSSETTSLDIFSMAFRSGQMPVFESDSSTSQAPDNNSLYTAYMSSMTLDTNNNSRTTTGTTTSVTPVNGVEFETGEGTFEQNYFGTTISISTSGSFTAFARGTITTDDSSINQGTIQQTDTNGSFNDNGTITTETMTRAKSQTEGSSNTSTTNYNIKLQTGRITLDSVQNIHGNSTYTEIATLTERELANGTRENVLNVGSFAEGSNRTITENATETIETERKPSVISQEVDSDDFYTHSGLSIESSYDVVTTNNQTNISSFTIGVFHNIEADYDRMGTFSSASTMKNIVTHDESGTGQTYINGEVSFSATAGRASFLHDAKNNGHFRSTSLVGESNSSHLIDMKSIEISWETQNGVPMNGVEPGGAAFTYVYNKRDTSRRTGAVADDSVVYSEATTTKSDSSTSSHWYDFRNENRTDAEIVGDIIGDTAAQYLPTFLGEGFKSTVDWWMDDVDLTGWNIELYKLDTRSTNSTSRSFETKETTEKSRLGTALSSSSQSTNGSNEVVPTFYVSLNTAHEGLSINRREQTSTQSKTFNLELAGEFARTVLFRSATSHGQKCEIRNQILEYEAAGNGTGSTLNHAQYSNYEIHRESHEIANHGDRIYHSKKSVNGSTADLEEFEDNDYFDDGPSNVGLGVTGGFQSELSIVHRDDTKDAYQEREHFEWFDKDSAPPDNPDAPTGWDGTDYGRSRRIDQTWADSGRTWENIEAVGSESTSNHTVWRTPTFEYDLYYYHSDSYSNTERNRSTVDWANPYFYWEADSRTETLGQYLDTTKNYHTIVDPAPSTWADTYYVAEALFWWDDTKEWVLDRLSEALDVASIVTDLLTGGMLGSVFDLMNAGLSYSRGRYGEMALNLAAATPLLGYAATAAKYAGKAANAVAKVGKHVGNVASMTNMGKGLANTVKTGGKTMETGVQVAKRAEDAGDAVKRSKATKKNTEPDSCPNPDKNQCFVGDTKVLIFAQVPEEIIANWAPVPLDPAQARSHNVLGMWFSLSAAGVVVAIGLRAARGKDEEEGSRHRRPRLQRTPGSSNSAVDEHDDHEGEEMTNNVGEQADHTIELGSSPDPNRIELPTVPPHVTTEELARWAQADVGQYLVDEYWDGQSLATEPVRQLSFHVITLPPQPTTASAPRSPSANDTTSESATGSLVFRSLPISEILGPARGSKPLHDSADRSEAPAAAVQLAPTEDSSRAASSWPVRWRAVLDWPHWTSAMWISLLLCLGTWMGFAWFDAPTNTATRPAGEVGAIREVDSRPVIAGWESFAPELLDIDKIRVGMRVAAENPEVSDAERRTFVDPDPETWRFLKLRLPKSADPRDFVEIEMLRPAAWLEQYTAEVGGRVLLDLEELGAKGWAEVLEIGPCPEIVPGPGSVVTATFAHQPTSEILDVTISVDRQSPGGLTLDQPSSQDTSSPASETIGVTANHPFWSVDHQAFIPVGRLEPGTRVKTHLDQIQTIVSLHPRPGPPEKVYNLEVHGEHVYYVGQSSVLAHNNGCGITAIGRMEDLRSVDNLKNVDTWQKTGRIPGAHDPKVTWKENKKWLDERIDRGDRFIILSDPKSLPPVKNGYIPGSPNGYFTARELEYLQSRNIKVEYITDISKL